MSSLSSTYSSTSQKLDKLLSTYPEPHILELFLITRRYHRLYSSGRTRLHHSTIGLGIVFITSGYFSTLMILQYEH